MAPKVGASSSSSAREAFQSDAEALKQAIAEAIPRISLNTHEVAIVPAGHVAPHVERQAAATKDQADVSGRHTAAGPPLQDTPGTTSDTGAKGVTRFAEVQPVNVPHARTELLNVCATATEVAEKDFNHVVESAKIAELRIDSLGCSRSWLAGAVAQIQIPDERLGGVVTVEDLLNAVDSRQ